MSTNPENAGGTTLVLMKSIECDSCHLPASLIDGLCHHCRLIPALPVDGIFKRAVGTVVALVSIVKSNLLGVAED